LRSTEFLGSESHLRVELTDGTLLDAVAAHHAAADPELLPRIGDRVRVEIPRHAVRAVIDSHDDVSA
ncbi:MAG: TOBE domain-containing protein, partial [Actinomycetota bacterium]|nr:TOBE domain-containing protein [Actinomycetota bacterium]